MAATPFDPLLEDATSFARVYGAAMRQLWRNVSGSLLASEIAGARDTLEIGQGSG
jgi:hypothetical protein